MPFNKSIEIINFILSPYSYLTLKLHLHSYVFSCDEQLKMIRFHSVRPFVFPSVHPSLFFLFVSLKFLLVLKRVDGVSRQFKERLNFNGSFKEVLRVFQWYFKDV